MKLCKLNGEGMSTILSEKASNLAFKLDQKAYIIAVEDIDIILKQYLSI